MKSFLIFFLLLIAAAAHAAEVKNLKVGQSGDKGFASFDLVGEVGERDADVSVNITIDGKKYSADRLTLTGDLGKKVKAGVGKRIVWDTLADIPAGFEGEATWEVTVSGIAMTANTITFPAKNGDVTFNHKMHVDKLKDCMLCHESEPGKIKGFGKDWAHKNCKLCHQEKSIGPRRCGDCHNGQLHLHFFGEKR